MRCLEGNRETSGQCPARTAHARHGLSRPRYRDTYSSHLYLNDVSIDSALKTRPCPSPLALSWYQDTDAVLFLAFGH